MGGGGEGGIRKLSFFLIKESGGMLPRYFATSIS